MEKEAMWKEIERILNLHNFSQSQYYDELFYLYIAHLANAKNIKKISELWGHKEKIRDSIHFFPAMLIQLSSLKKNSALSANTFACSGCAMSQ